MDVVDALDVKTREIVAREIVTVVATTVVIEETCAVRVKPNVKRGEVEAVNWT